MHADLYKINRRPRTATYKQNPLNSDIEIIITKFGGGSDHTALIIAIKLQLWTALYSKLEVLTHIISRSWYYNYTHTPPSPPHTWKLWESGGTGLPSPLHHVSATILSAVSLTHGETLSESWVGRREGSISSIWNKGNYQTSRHNDIVTDCLLIGSGPSQANCWDWCQSGKMFSRIDNWDSRRWDNSMKYNQWSVPNGFHHTRGN